MKNISKSFPGIKVLDDVNLTLKKGEVHAICGENGAGKSTLVKILSGVLEKDNGDILIQGESVIIDNRKKSEELGIGMVFQEFNLFPDLSIADNIFMSKYPKKCGLVSHKMLYTQTQDILDELGIELSPKMKVKYCSIAQQQMIEIAKLFSCESKIIILDEPTAALTESEIQVLFALINKLKKNGVGIIYISHRLEELSQIVDRVSVLQGGKCIKTMEFQESKIEEIISLMIGKDIKEKFPTHKREIGNIKLDIKRLVTNKINISDFQIKSGEIVAVAGLMGAGRTSFAKSLFGIDKVELSDIYIDGNIVNITSVQDAIKKRIGYISEDRKNQGLALNMSVEDNINMTSIRSLSKCGVYDNHKSKNQADYFVEQLKIKTNSIKQKVSTLSGGNQQKIVISKWLCNEVDIMIFDEPTRGIDIGAKLEVYNLMNDLSSKGVAILMISSEIPEVLGMSDRVAIMKKGEIVMVENTEKLTSEDILQYSIYGV